MIGTALKIAIEGQNPQHVLADTPVRMPSVCNLPRGLFFNIDLQTQDTVALSLELCLMYLYQTYHNDNTTTYTLLGLNIRAIIAWFVYEPCQAVALSQWFDLGS